MTKDQIDSIKAIAFTLADGVAIVFPVTASVVAIVEKAVNLLEDAGLAPHELTPEQATAVAAGIAAVRASAVTEYLASTKKT